ncbi:MAG TPA: NAD(P)H-binding protein [Candidatus Acidoferrum sp.]|nr:NAD(P)H-binding protein [Candidatus Acidoferrum sp.]
MRIAITGGTGFVGGHLAIALAQQGHETLVIARGVDRRPWAADVLSTQGVRLIKAGLGDEKALRRAFAGCDAVAHCAGINRELGSQTYDAVHVEGTRHAVHAAEHAGVRRIALLSFLRARPNSGSAYHETKWAAEEIVRASRLEWTVLKPGMIFGRGDHMLDHLTRALCTFPVFVSMGRRRVRPLAVGDIVDILTSALVKGRLARKTIPVTGPTELVFDDAVRLVSEVIGKRPVLVRLPIGMVYGAAWFAERLMTVPLIAAAQVRILEEEVVDPALAPDPLPDDLFPSTPFDAQSVRAGVPACTPFGLRDLRLFQRRASSLSLGER